MSQSGWLSRATARPFFLNVTAPSGWRGGGLAVLGLGGNVFGLLE